MSLFIPKGPLLTGTANLSAISVSMLNMNDTNIINLANPVNETDAVNKNYADSVVMGTLNTLPYFNESGLASIPGSLVNPNGILTLSRLNLTGFGDTALTSVGLVSGTTIQGTVLTSPNAFTANSFFTPRIGFFAITPIAQQTLTVGDSTLDDVINFLKAYGLSA
jgi:hypothetical protein